MKTLSIFTLGLGLFSASAFANPVLRCSKRIPTTNSFNWAVIEESTDGSLVFEYGAGDDQDLMEIHFTSPVAEANADHYTYSDSSYSLDATVVRGKLTFVLKAGHTSKTYKNYICSP